MHTLYNEPTNAVVHDRDYKHTTHTLCVLHTTYTPVHIHYTRIMQLNLNMRANMWHTSQQIVEACLTDLHT